MNDTDYSRFVISKVFGINPNTADTGWDSDLAWCVMQYGELKSAHMWSEYLINVDHDAGEIDDLQKQRKMKKLNEWWDEDITTLTIKARESIENG